MKPRGAEREELTTEIMNMEDSDNESEGMIMEDSDNESEIMDAEESDTEASDASFDARDAIEQAIWDEDLDAVQEILQVFHIDQDVTFELAVDAIDQNIDPEVLRLLAERCPNICEMRVGYPFSLLHYACDEGASAEIIQLLVEQNPSIVREKSEGGFLPLHCACRNFKGTTSVETVRLLLSLYPDSVREADGGGYSVLMMALHAHLAEEIVFAILDQCPESASFPDSFGVLPLFDSFRLPNVLQQLVNVFPESIFITNDQGDLPLHHACSNTDTPLEAVKVLVEKHPVSVQVKDASGRLPLHRAIDLGRTETIEARYAWKEVVEFLLDTFPDAVSNVDDNGKLPIHSACRRRAPIETVQLLLNHHNDSCEGLDAVDTEGQIPLHYAVLPETVQLLLNKYPAGTRVADRNGMLPLHKKSSYLLGSRDAVHLLLNADPLSVLTLSGNGMTPLQLALRSFNQIITETRDLLDLLAQKQDEAVRLIRDAIREKGEDFGLPDLVVSAVCSFLLPKILSPMEREMTW